MSRTRITLQVRVDLDPVPGWGHTAEDWRRWLESYLFGAASHYDPVVELVEGAS